MCYYDEDEGEAEDEDYMPLITSAGPADEEAHQAWFAVH